VTTNLPLKFLNRFIELNVKQKEGLDLDLAIAVITDLSKTYTEVSKIPMEATTSPAPFQGRSAEECFKLLQAFMRDTGSDVNVKIFAILDERSKEDDTVVIVKASEKTGDIKTVRGALKETDMSLVNLWVGNSNIEECSHELTDWGLENIPGFDVVLQSLFTVFRLFGPRLTLFVTDEVRFMSISWLVGRCFDKHLLGLSPFGLLCV